MRNVAHAETARSQLRRLSTLTDVVYAGALILIVFWLPRPEESASQSEVSKDSQRFCCSKIVETSNIEL